MSFNQVKNAGIAGLLLLLIATAFWGVRSIGALLDTLTETVQVHNPAQMTLVKLNERLSASNDRLLAYLYRDRITGDGVSDALADLRRHFESVTELAPTAPPYAVLDTRPGVSAQRAFQRYLQETNDSDPTSERAQQMLKSTRQQLFQARDALAAFASSLDMSRTPKALRLMIEVSSDAVLNAESMLDRFLHRKATRLEDVLGPLSDAQGLLDSLVDRDSSRNDGRAQSTSSTRTIAPSEPRELLRQAIAGARAALFAYQDGESYDSGSADLMPGLEETVRAQWAHLSVALLQVNEVLGERSEAAQRAAIADGELRQQRFLVLTAGTVVLALLISLAMSRIIRTRLQLINTGARKFSDGLLSHRIPEGVNDELGGLARTFNRMAARLEKKERDLEAQVLALDRANKEAVMSNAHLDRLIDSIPDALLVVDAEKRIVRSNPAALALVGHEDDGLSGTPLSSVLDLHALSNNCDEVLASTEAELITKNGERVPVNLSTAKTKASDSNSTGLIIIAQDIRTAKLAERRRAMKYTVTRLLAGADTLAEVMPEILETIGNSLGYVCGAYWRWDPARGLLFPDHSWDGGDSAKVSAFLSCQQSNDPSTPGGGLIRRTWNTGEYAWIDDLSSRTDFQRASFAKDAQLRGGLAIPIWDGLTTYGALELFSRSCAPPEAETLQDCQSICAQIAHFCRRKDAEQALHEKTERLEQSNRELDQFAYITSHDLKAPLRAIANLATWIEEDLGEHLSGEISEHMVLLRGRVDRMEALIQGILDYSRIGRESVRTEAVDLSELLAEVVDSLPVPTDFQIKINDSMPVISASKVRLTQIFANLIGNAIKYHDRLDGEVNLTVKNVGDWYEFAIEDDGPGIPDEFHEKVFGIFQTLEARDKVESTGIGLTLVKKIIEEQGGSISIAPHAGRGARFCFTWPIERQAA